MSRRLTAPVATAAAFVVFVFVLFTFQGVFFDSSIEATNRFGVLLVAIAGALATAAGAYVLDDPHVAEPAVGVTLIAPVAVLAIVLALLSGADSTTNVAAAIMGPLGALAGVYIFARVRR